MKKTVCIFILCLSIVSCRDYEVTPCDKVPEEPAGIGWQSDGIIDSLKCKLPCFNPLNPNEFLFVRDKKLFVFDMETSTKYLLYEGTLLSRPQWGTQGWILLNLPDGIWKIKDTGDSLLQIADHGFDPVWNHDFTKFVYAKATDGKFSGVIMDINGEVLGTSRYSGSAWNHPIYITSGTGIMDLAADTLIRLIERPDDNIEQLGATFLSDERTIVSSFLTGIYTIDIYTKKCERIRKSCNGVVYSSPSYSPMIQKILWTKRETIVVDDNYLRVTHRLVMMNPDGTEEEEIDIPR